MVSSNYQKKDGRKVPILGQKIKYQIWDNFFHLIIILLMGIDFLLYNKHINVKTTQYRVFSKKYESFKIAFLLMFTLSAKNGGSIKMNNYVKNMFLVHYFINLIYDT